MPTFWFVVFSQIQLFKKKVLLLFNKIAHVCWKICQCPSRSQLCIRAYCEELWQGNWVAVELQWNMQLAVNVNRLKNVRESTFVILQIKINNEHGHYPD